MPVAIPRGGARRRLDECASRTSSAHREAVVQLHHQPHPRRVPPIARGFIRFTASSDSRGGGRIRLGRHRDLRSPSRRPKTAELHAAGRRTSLRPEFFTALFSIANNAFSSVP
jgi:hypothetical protein